MSYTTQTLVNDAYEALKASGAPVPPSLIPRLSILVPTALRLLPARIRERFGDAEAEIYRKNFTVALTAGQGSLATHTDLTSEPMIPSEIVKVTHPSAVTDTNASGRLYKVNSESILSLMRSNEFAYFAVDDNILYTMMNDDRTVLTGNATVRAAYPPAIATVKFAHEPYLLELLISLVQPVAA